MGKILDYIQQSGNGKYECYKTKKMSLDSHDNDTIAYNYDDNSVVHSTKSDFAETDRLRKSTVSLVNSLKSKDCPSPPIFKYFLDGSRHTYKVDDIAIGKKIFPILAGQIGVACCQRQSPDKFKCPDGAFERKLVLSLPKAANPNAGDAKLFFNSLTSKVNKLSTLEKRGIE